MKFIFLGLVAMLLLLAACGGPTGPAPDFAKCVTERGATFYGAYWCPHCKAQKELFGDSMKYVQYVECAEGNGQTQRCKDEGIESYPTWKFSSGKVLTGTLPLATLAQETGCQLT